ncbi:hypothetical protein RRV45_13195 [Bacillus sp. DTU_2020_1000418_1_SI_GHA_SEK_038]|uniref:hypothetical protein n=1 Tax=Bacillus sp. DTU_2020_1000418_1_SI_GHA_SEK_038 TaxID=3077585 RepID=UPI0028E58380|nr:hypothetical protein [Bacillus sp. DTU_2020_1000418_1_SI_GHA_SEK_038]WNS73874.1 hypothetical protein RRV45_13195 [Bacillus sp. DTU_2020_1000418_1_SI_GHA_SEK_038]
MKFFIAFLLFITTFIHDTNVQASESLVGHEIEMLPWEQVNKILPKFSKFTVMDVETGKKFKVQRRAGSHHADVQPLTLTETKIMKEIYDGKWSWKRRAIIVIHKGKWLAASMHGMPHGAGALQNNFPGHFCIHFHGSTTHRTNFMDLSHKLMILKAAGKLKEYAGSADPYEIISAYITGYKQQDASIVSSFSLQEMKGKGNLKKIENINLNRMAILPVEDLSNELSIEVPVEIDMTIRNAGRKSFNESIYLVRFSYADPWKVDTVRFLQDIHKKT